MARPGIYPTRNPLVHAALALTLLFWPALGQTALQTLHTGPPPAWVERAELEPERPLPPGQESGGQVLTLIDTEVNVAKGESFIHVLKEISGETGVQSGANLEFTWDPSYQELVLHQVTVHRGAQAMDRFDLSKVKIIQQETDLNRQIYNGTLSAVLFLEDVRLGDRIEYAYTLQGENPSLNGRFSESFILGSGVPIQHRRIRLLWPEERSLRFRLRGTTVAPTLRTHDGMRECIWDQHDLPAVVVEDQIPSWFPAYPWLQFSEFKDWSEVAEWATGVFASTNLDAPELKEQIDKLRRLAAGRVDSSSVPKREPPASSSTEPSSAGLPAAEAPAPLFSVPLWGASAEQLLQSALEFAQSDIRYLGIEFGPHSYHPTDPLTVLHRRFGDCKDKALLLCSLLRGLGYDCSPVLVATGFRQTLPELLPAPTDFDHVIVRVVANGATYWLDPTRSYQHAPLNQRYVPAYGFGLLVRPGQSDLVRIPRSTGGFPETATTEVFRIGGQKSPAQLSVVTTLKGFDAEWMRSALAAGGRDRIAKGYLNDYAQRYPGVTPAAPIEVEDSATRDTLVLRHAYSITNFWTLSTDKQRYQCQFYPLGIHTWLMKPATAIRSMPMELSFPRRRFVQTRLELPREFKLTNLTNTVIGPAAELHVQRTYQGRTVWLNYEYRSRTNFVPVSLTAEHLKSLDRMENELTYALNWQNLEGPGVQGRVNWPILVLASTYAVILAAGLGWFSLYHSRRSAPAASAPPLIGDPNLRGLGGWLVLVGIGLVFGPLRLFTSMASSLTSYSPFTWHALTSPGAVSYQPAWAPVLIGELLGQISILILGLIVLTLYFQKRRIFPRWYIAYLSLNALFVAADALGLQALNSSNPGTSERLARNFLQVCIGCGIWIPYMLRSLRVKATFVR